MLGLCFNLLYFVSFLALFYYLAGGEGWLLYFCSALNVMSLLSFFFAVPWVGL